MKENYLFKSKRLGFRKWTTNDLAELVKLNADQAVMEFFPKTLTEKESRVLLERFISRYDNHGHTYYATEILDTKELIGFIGLAYQDYKSDFTPGIDIGWRLKKSAWGNGYATEGAKRCLEYAFNDLKIKNVFSICSIGNTKSENVMKKIGMHKKAEFKYEALSQHPHLELCVGYLINKSQLL